MVAGAPFPDLLDWTWGEIIEFIECKNEARQEELRENASMYFHTVMMMGKVIGAKKGQTFKITDEYKFLWSQEDLDKMAMEEFERKMMASVRKEDREKYGL